jgi:hypothetical protein
VKDLERDEELSGDRGLTYRDLEKLVGGRYTYWRDLLAETRAQRERTGDLAHALRFCGWVAAIGMILLLAFALKR